MDLLFDKVYGCIGAAIVGSAMGGPVENCSHEYIKETYGFLNRMVDYPKGADDKHNSGFPAGSTEDGVERIKILSLSIIENGGPVTARDFAKTWIKYVKEEGFGVVAGQQDEIHYRLIKAGISPEDSGYYDAHPGRMGFNRACQPIGIIHACFPEQAAKNALDVARVFQPPTGRGIQWKESSKIFPVYTIGIDWSAAIAAAIAEAFKPSATIDSIMKAGTEFVVPPVRDEIISALELADQCSDYEQLVHKFNKRYHATGMPMCNSRAYEITSKAFAIVKFSNGNVADAILYSVNFGRDTDCLAAVAGAICGAYSGSSGLLQEWVEDVDRATLMNAFTVCQDSIYTLAEKLYLTLKKFYKRKKDDAMQLEALMENSK